MLEIKKFLWRLLLHIITFLCIMLPLMIAGAIILLCFLPFSNEKKLPYILRWFDNADMYINRNTSVYEAVCDKGWWARYTWLAFRNPINYFGYVHLGMKWTSNHIYTHYNPANDNVGDGTRSGFKYIEVIEYDERSDIESDKYYYEYYWIYQYPFAKKFCCRFRIGWKIGNATNKIGSISQWVLVFNPMHPW